MLLLGALLFFNLWTDCQTNKNDLQDLHKWWAEMSQQKPISCKVNYELASKPSNQQTVNLIKNRKCEPNEEPTSQVKHGLVQDGLLQDGVAKIVFSGQNTNGSTCFDLNGIVSLTGNFKQGFLHGMAKIKTEEGLTIISNYINGQSFGLTRVWNDQNQLIEVYFTEDRPNKMGWALVEDGQFLLYRDYSYYKSGELVKTLVIPAKNQSIDIMAGHFEATIMTLFEVELVEIEKLQKDFCIIQVDWKPKKKVNWDFNLPTSQQLPHFHQSIINCPKPQGKRSGKQEFKQFMQFLGNAEVNHEQVLALNRLKPEESPVEAEKVRWHFMSNFTVVNPQMVNLSIWNGPIHTWSVEYMSVDEKGQLHGYCAFELTNEALVNQTGYFTPFRWSIKSFSGKFIHGHLDGIAVMRRWFGGTIYATFRQGVMHGPVLSMGQIPLLHFGLVLENEVYLSRHGMQFYGRFRNGQAFGPVWASYYRNGYLYGPVDSNGDLTGDFTFIYGDGETALQGQFEHGEMKHARYVDVLEYTFNNEGQFMPHSVTEPLTEDIFFFDPPTNVSFGGGDVSIRDPYEEKHVKLALSSLPNGEQGVFLASDQSKATIVAFYSLFLYKAEEQLAGYISSCTHNTSKSDDYRRHCKKYSLPMTPFPAQHDLPPELDRWPLPNLGPKVNHHFFQNNSGYLVVEHPRWGLISAVGLTKDVKTGEEIFTHYGYGRNDFPNDFPWYFESKLQLEREQRLHQEKKKSKKPKKAPNKNAYEKRRKSKPKD